MSKESHMKESTKVLQECAEIQTKTVQTKRGGIARAKIKTTSDATMKFDGKNKPTTTRDVRVEKTAPRTLK